MSARTTQAFVGLVLAVAGVWSLFMLTTGWWPWVLLVILGFEGWTIFNRTPADTISEIIWQLAERPILPLLSGVAVGHFIPTEELWVVGLGVLLGHFFWQRHEVRGGL